MLPQEQSLAASYLFATAASAPHAAKAPPARLRQSQQGIALAMSLIFLLILTLLAVVSMNTGTLQEKMTGNMRDLDISFESAESALWSAQGDIAVRLRAGVVPDCLNNVNGIWCPNVVDWKTGSWWAANGIDYGGSGKQITETYEDPRYAIEDLLDKSSTHGADQLNEGQGPVKVPRYLRMHSRGVGATGIAESILHGYTPVTATK